MMHRLRLVVALLILIILGLACAWIIGVGPVIVEAQINATSTPAGMVPVGCWMPNGTWLYWADCPMRVVTATPPMATDTPTPTITPSATSTPPAEDTPTVEPGGTPEPTEPGPTETPLKTCTLRSITVVNVRNGPGTSYGIRDKWQQGAEREFVRFNNDDRDYLWGYSDDGAGGWTAIYDKATADWFVSGTQGAVLCVDLPGWPAGLIPPVPFAMEPALLWHAVPGGNALEMLDSYHILASKGIQFGVKPFADMNRCLDALNEGGICIFRHGWPDCPSGVGEVDPVDSARKFADYGDWAANTLRNYENAYYEPVNECHYGNFADQAPLYWWRDWMMAYIDEAQARGFPKLVLPTLGPGHGDATMFRIWQPALERLAATGGLFGQHAYTPHHDDGLCACDEWTACRHQRNYRTMAAIGFSIDTAITEAARGWGNDPVDEADFVCWYDQIRGDSYVRAVALWTAGPVFPWLNAQLDGHMVPIARAITP